MNELPIEERIHFHQDIDVMEVDFSDVTFDSAKQVNEFYDLVDQRIADSNQEKWYFLVNYRNCKLTPPAWIPFANRGKKVNIAHSLGTVRFEASEQTQKTIEEQSKSNNFDSNLVETRDSALAKLAGLRRVANS